MAAVPLQSLRGLPSARDCLRKYPPPSSMPPKQANNEIIEKDSHIHFLEVTIVQQEPIETRKYYASAISQIQGQ